MKYSGLASQTLLTQSVLRTPSSTYLCGQPLIVISGQSPSAVHG
jgi:hypothetical protein